MFGFLSALPARAKHLGQGFVASSAQRSQADSASFSGSASPGDASGHRTRSEVKPPSLRCTPESGWHRFMFWMLAPAPLDAAPPLSRLPAVRADFLACLDGTDDAQARQIGQRIHRARSLRELWHLRAALFGYLACHFSQAEAQRRLQALDRHFGSRAIRSTADSPTS
jgi:hypothetical protein